VARAGQFFAARRAAGQRRVPTMQTLGPLLAYLQDQQVLPLDQPAAATPAEELLASYRGYLVRERGAAPLTVLRYERMARRFPARPRFAGRHGDRGGEPEWWRGLGLRSGEVAALQLGDIDWRASRGTLMQRHASH
jgi:integrase